MYLHLTPSVSSIYRTGYDVLTMVFLNMGPVRLTFLKKTNGIILKSTVKGGSPDYNVNRWVKFGLIVRLYGKTNYDLI